ncbi:MAG TPA: HPr-rel-A system PqqD family peptide chaperone [Accumulibacter sp.]|jgi:PqqD family protein of HPr-rel-A system|nr:HPr-rel-A system PqqD family peptide chaperone [Accumulibacter sp.]
MLLLPAGTRLIWQKCDELYFVYQPSSTETHVFNETSATIIACLKTEPLSMVSLRERTETALGLSIGELETEEFTFAVVRLEELGLIDFDDEPIVAR